MKFQQMKGHRTCVLYAMAMALDSTAEELLAELEPFPGERDGFLLHEFHASIVVRGRLYCLVNPYLASPNFPDKVFCDNVGLTMLNFSRAVIAGYLGSYGYHAMAYSPETGYVCPANGPVVPEKDWCIHEILLVPTDAEYGLFCEFITATKIKGKYEDADNPR